MRIFSGQNTLQMTGRLKLKFVTARSITEACRKYVWKCWYGTAFSDHTPDSRQAAYDQKANSYSIFCDYL